MGMDVSWLNEDDYKEEECVPEGKYLVEVIFADEKYTQEGEAYCNVCYKILEGDHKGRWIFDPLHLNAENSVRANIARKNLYKLASAAGVEGLKNTGMLIGKRLYVTYKRNKKDYPTYFYKSLPGQPVKPSQTPTPQAPIQQAQAQQSTPPSESVSQPTQAPSNCPWD